MQTTITGTARVCFITQDNKSSAYKYLNYALSVGEVEEEAYYFLGKAYHLTFQFNKAIANYSKYQQRAGDRVIRRLKVDRQIEVCVNAKSLFQLFQIW